MSAVIDVLRDLRVAIWSLRRSPGFTLIAIATLGLGVGANTSMFSILNGYMLRPAPYAERDRLDRIYRVPPRGPRGSFSPADYLELKEATGGYGEIAAYADSNVSLSEPGRSPEVAEGMRVSANLLTVLGCTPLLGRDFRPEEEIPGNDRVLILSHRYWQKRFGGDPRVIGHTVRIDGEPYEIVGVLPQDFSDWRHLASNDVYRPLALDEREARDRNATWIRIVGLRARSVTHAQAEAVITGVGRRLAREFPAADAGSTWRVVPIDDSFLDRDGPPILAMLICLSGFVVLIACSNLANLLLARTLARAREFALRAALGASRARVLRPLVVESLVLAFAGGVCALLVAGWTFRWLEVISAGDNGVGAVFTFDWRVLAWTSVACLFTALAFGAAPALFALRLDLNSTLKSGARGTTSGRGSRRFGQWLIVGQFALAIILLAGAALFVRGLHEINNRRHGWESDRLVTGTVVLPASRYPGDQEIVAFQRLAIERVTALPDVASASLSYSMPFFGLSEPRRYVVAGHDTPQPGSEPAAVINAVTPRYFETVGTPLLAGRVFTDGDGLAAPKVFIVNRAMARGLFGDGSAIGHQIAQAGGPSPEWGTIIGVVADVESVFPGQVTAPYQLYLPLAQEPRPTAQIAVRTAGGAPAGVVGSVRTAIAALDPDLPVRKLQPAAASIERANYPDGVLAAVLSRLATLGLLLASLGVYGVIARTVAQRTGEFGIRLALGAQPRDVIRLVLTSGARLAAVGSAVGVLGALGIAKLIAAEFPGMRTQSAPVLAGVTLLVVAVALLASYMPARNAARISPIETLRAE
jgi:putative ABC transport system permease protein